MLLKIVHACIEYSHASYSVITVVMYIGPLHAIFLESPLKEMFDRWTQPVVIGWHSIKENLIAMYIVLWDIAS